ncbi:Palmitoyltransferase ZDHHC17 [Anopheles sinensis]|uniref:Palmitoyltransferase ZDHHC17 n=1 Tax=Anopheles sinensis TaxID=74873 RepID=A0A084WFU8_ANOSI|nr:Palmitoyltransferase ZDHHC17 [Anopheles sinensis]
MENAFPKQPRWNCGKREEKREQRSRHCPDSHDVARRRDNKSSSVHNSVIQTHKYSVGSIDNHPVGK